MAVAIRENLAIRDVEASAERPDRTRFSFLAYATPFRQESGELVGAMNAMVDITGRKQAEAALLSPAPARWPRPSHDRHASGFD